MTPKITLEELLKDQVGTCGKCGGPLYVHPFLCPVKLEGSVIFLGIAALGGLVWLIGKCRKTSEIF